VLVGDEAMNWPSTLPRFLWGAATSSHQIEGNTFNDWTRWEEAGHVVNRERSGRSTNHFANPEADLILFSQLGWNAYRFSLEWTRIEPKPGEFSTAAIKSYRAIVDTLRRLRIEPLVTLHHFTLPQWFADQGGFFASDAEAHFLDYVSYVLDHLGDAVTLWITINEPMVYTVMGYAEGSWPPGERSLVKGWHLTNHLMDLHQKTYQQIKRRFPTSLVGLAHHLAYFMPYSSFSLTDRTLARVIDRVFNWRFIDKVQNHQDFVGINYYTRQWISARRGLIPIMAKPGAPVTQMGWEVFPEGLYYMLQHLKPYRKPILITENGIATNEDSDRQHYLVSHLQQIAKAQSDAIDVRGYFHWSALDNFEWAEGYRPRFGLIDVNYETLKRSPRPSAMLYRKIIAINQENLGDHPIIVPSALQ
jgi:beta-glucosidase